MKKSEIREMIKEELLKESWAYVDPKIAYDKLEAEIYKSWKKLKKDDPKVFKQMQAKYKELGELHEKMYGLVYDIFS